MTTLTAIKRGLIKARKSEAFGFDEKLKREQNALISHYGDQGRDAARLLDDHAAIAKQVEATAPLKLAYLGQEWTEWREIKKPSSIARKIRERRIPWWRTAFELRCERGSEPDWSEVGLHDDYTENTLVNRFIGECSIQLADHYHKEKANKPFGPTKRSEEHDALLLEFADVLPKFAKQERSHRFSQAMQIAGAYRSIEPTRVKLADEALVSKGAEAFERIARGAELSDRVKLGSGATAALFDIVDFIQTLAELPTFGEWGKAKAPAKALAYARAIQRFSTQGVAITANLNTTSLGRAQTVERATGSAIQDSLRRHLSNEFDKTPDFYFVVENGLGQQTHIHGAASVDPTSENIRKVRSALIRLCEPKDRPGKERSVDVSPLQTPAKWAAYSFKHPMTSMNLSGVGSLLRSTRPLTRKAKEEWELMRQEQRDARSVMRGKISS